MTKKSVEPVEEQKTEKAKWGPVAALVVVIVTYAASQFIAIILLSIYPALRHWSYAEAQQWLSNSNYAQFFLTVLVEATVLILLKIFLNHRKATFKDLGLKGRPGLLDIGYVIAGFAVYFSVYYLTIVLLQQFNPNINLSQKQDLGFTSSAAGQQLVLIFISLVLLPPIVEEILFRGFLYTGLRSKLPKIIAALIVSAIFASLHLLEGFSGLLWIAGLDTFILSLVLVYLREKTGRLWAPMGLHMTKNFIAFAVLYLFHIS
jgi:membrane protease YdiL (CAAX protease family)